MILLPFCSLQRLREGREATNRHSASLSGARGPPAGALEPGRGFEPKGGHSQVTTMRNVRMRPRSCWNSAGRPRGPALGMSSKYATLMATLVSWCPVQILCYQARCFLCFQTKSPEHAQRACAGSPPCPWELSKDRVPSTVCFLPVVQRRPSTSSTSGNTTHLGTEP